jgi:hypothetical protein
MYGTMRSHQATALASVIPAMSGSSILRTTSDFP